MNIILKIRIRSSNVLSMLTRNWKPKSEAHVVYTKVLLGHLLDSYKNESGSRLVFFTMNWCVCFVRAPLILVINFILFQLSHVTIAEHVRIPHVVEIRRYIVDDLVDAVSLIPFYGGRIMESKCYGFLSVLERAVVCLYTGLSRTF